MPTVDDAAQLRADAESSASGIVDPMLCTVADITGDHAPEVWRGFPAVPLDGPLRPGEGDLPGLSLAEVILRDALLTDKQRLLHSARYGQA